MDLNKSLRAAIDTGNVFVGSKQACKAIEAGSAKLVILASNCPEDTVNTANSGIYRCILSTETTRFWELHAENLSQYLLLQFWTVESPTC